MSQFLFYDTRGTTTQFSDKKRFRLQPGARSHTPIDRDPTRISGPISGTNSGVVDDAKTTPSTSEAADDSFNESSDSDDSLHSLFSDFTDEWPDNPGCNPDDVPAMPLSCPQNAIISPAVLHDDVNTDDADTNLGEGSFEPLKLDLDRSPSAVSHGQHTKAAPSGVPPFAPSNSGRSRRNFTNTRSGLADPFKITCNDSAIADTRQLDTGTQTYQIDIAHTDAGMQTDQADTAHTDAGTQTDQVDIAHTDAGTQTDQHNVHGSETGTSEPTGASFNRMEQRQAAHSEEGQPSFVWTRENQEDGSFGQQDYGVRCIGGVDAVNSVGSNESSYHRQRLPDVVPTDSTYSHNGVPHRLVNSVHRSHHLPIHGFFTIHEPEGQLAYTLTFFESMTHAPLHWVDGESPILAQDEAVEELSTMADVTVHDSEVSSVFSSSRSADAQSLLLSRDGSPEQHPYISTGQKGDPFSPEDDALLVQLKGERIPWKKIAKFFPGRSKGSLQNHYCTKLKRNLPEDGQEEERMQKRVRAPSNPSADEAASCQLQRELDWIAKDITAAESA